MVYKIVSGGETWYKQSETTMNAIINILFEDGSKKVVVYNVNEVD